MVPFVNKPATVVTKTVVYKTELYKVLPGLMLEVAYADDVITAQKLIAHPGPVKKWLSPFAREQPKHWFLATPLYLEDIKVKPWYEAESYEDKYKTADILADFQANGIQPERILGIVDRDEIYAWGTGIQIRQVFGGDETRHNVGEKRNYGPIKWDYPKIKQFLTDHPQVHPFEEIDQNRYDHETHKRKMGIEYLEIEYTREQIVNVQNAILRYVSDKGLKFKGPKLHEMLVNHLNLRELVPGADVLGAWDCIKEVKHTSWDAFLPKPKATKDGART